MNFCQKVVKPFEISIILKKVPVLIKGINVTWKSFPLINNSLPLNLESYSEYERF